MSVGDAVLTVLTTLSESGFSSGVIAGTGSELPMAFGTDMTSGDAQ